VWILLLCKTDCGIFSFVTCRVCYVILVLSDPSHLGLRTVKQVCCFMSLWSSNDIVWHVLTNMSWVCTTGVTVFDRSLCREMYAITQSHRHWRWRKDTDERCRRNGHQKGVTFLVDLTCCLWSSSRTVHVSLWIKFTVQYWAVVFSALKLRLDVRKGLPSAVWKIKSIPWRDWWQTQSEPVVTGHKRI